MKKIYLLYLIFSSSDARLSPQAIRGQTTLKLILNQNCNSLKRPHPSRTTQLMRHTDYIKGKTFLITLYFRAVVYRQYACFGSRQTGFNSRQPDINITCHFRRVIFLFWPGIEGNSSTTGSSESPWLRRRSESDGGEEFPAARLNKIIRPQADNFL